MTYGKILEPVEQNGHYLTDTIGKCRRTVSTRGRGHRIDLDYSESETYEAYKQRVNLSKLFDRRNAREAFLIWVEVPGTGEKSEPFPILIDDKSGVIRGKENNTVRFGLLLDVAGCVYTKADLKRL
jgi:hypothetical protein